MRYILLTLFTFMISGQALAQPAADEAVDLLESENGFGIRATALGNAYTAVADDYSAIYWNPAGLAQIKSGQFSGDINYLKFNNTARYFDTETDDNRNFTKLQSIGLVYPFPVARGNCVIAFGYQRIKSLDNFLSYSGYTSIEKDWVFEHDPSDDELYQTQINSTDGSLSQWSFGGAIDLSPNFSAGLSINIYDGGSEYTSDFEQEYLHYIYEYDSIEFNYFGFQQKIQNDYSGIEFKIGGLFHLNKFIRLGTTITFPMTLAVEESWSESESLVLDDTSEGIYDVTEIYYDSDDYDYLIKVPFKFSAGISYQTQSFLIGAAIDYRDWSQLKYEVPDNCSGETYDLMLDENKYFRQDYRAVVSYSLGGEFNLLNGISLRGGFRYLPSPIKNIDTKYDKKYYSAGIGYKVDEMTTIEMSCMQGQWENRSYDVYTWETDEKIKTTNITMGVRLSF